MQNKSHKKFWREFYCKYWKLQTLNLNHSFYLEKKNWKNEATNNIKYTIIAKISNPKP